MRRERSSFTRGASHAALATAWCILAAGVAPAEAQETPTRVMVRAVAHDAKIIGSGVGGARITIRTAEGGEVLARGVQEGGTGDTGKLVVDPRVRGESVYDTEGAAGFLAELDLDRPTRVEITAEGPLGTPHALQSASRTLLLVPGRDVVGDGVILELHGFTVELLEPTAGDDVAAGSRVTVQARVTMLCGCPTEPGGLWDANDIDVLARIVRDGRVLRETPIDFVEGVPSTWRGAVDVPEGQDLTLQVLAADNAKGNFGMVERPLTGTGTADPTRGVGGGESSRDDATPAGPRGEG